MHRTSASVGLRRVVTLGAAIAVAGSTVLVAAAPVAAAPRVVTGATIVVNDYTDPPANSDGGQCTLREAVEAAQSDTASGVTAGECAAGTGADTIVFDATGPVAITLGLELGITTDVTIDGGGNVLISGNDAVRAFNVTAGSLQLRNLSIQHTTTTGQGGAVFGDVGTHIGLDHVTISSSSANQGGAIGAQGTLTIVDSTISNNTSVNIGGGLFANGDTTIQRSTISNNTAGSTSGGMETEGGTIVISDSSFIGNTALDTPGGGLYAQGGPVFIDNSTFEDNAATDGAAIFHEGQTLVVTASTIDNNAATGNGAGIWASAPVSVTNSTIANNDATGRGGAIFRTGNLMLTHATIALNSAGDALGGDGVDSGGSAGSVSTLVRNTVIAGNGTADWANWGGSLLTPGVATNSKVGLGANTLSQLLDPAGLQQNGGPTKTIRPVSSSTNPLLGAGDSAVCAGDPADSLDQRGFGRTAPCDIGAVELDRTKPVASGAKASLRRGVALAGTGMRVRLSWSASDVDSGIDHYVVKRSVNGGAYTTIGSPTTKAFDTTVSNGSSYRFRITPVDKVGNVGSYVTTPSFTARLVQQSASSVSYRGTWSTTSSSVFSGGSARKSSSSGASVTYSGTGRSFAFVSTVGPGRGKAKVYVDGVFRETIDLGGPNPSVFRSQVWSRTFSGSATHTVRIVVAATPTRPRVDADAFAVLR